MSLLGNLLAGLWSRVSLTSLLLMIRDRNLLIKVSAVTLFSDSVIRLYELSKARTIEGFQQGLYLFGRSVVESFVGSLNRISTGLLKISGELTGLSWGSLVDVPHGIWLVFTGFTALYILSKILPLITSKVTGGSPDMIHRVLYWGLFVVSVLWYNGYGEIQVFVDSVTSFLDTLAELQSEPGVNDSMVNGSKNLTGNVTGG
jgi:hypothetical protein